MNLYAPFSYISRNVILACTTVFHEKYNISHIFSGDIWYENTVCNTIHVNHVAGSGRYVAG